jgi:redox-sensitive bicupin YhaK (pirin superfamily)
MIMTDIVVERAGASTGKASFSSEPRELAPTGEIAREPRRIVHRTRGSKHGPITRLVSPSDVGELIKPFVFLDLFAMETPGGGGFGWHPHSGIATLTVLLEGAVRYEETTGVKGELPAGGVEWMRAGNGVWHTGAPADAGPVLGFQLWVALPAALENGPAVSHYVQPDEVPVEGPVRVILGRHGAAVSPIAAPPTMNYLVVTLKAGERWTYQPPAGHTVGWIAVHQGKVQTPAPVAKGELAVFEPSNDAIDFVAEGDTAFVLGSAIPHPHELVLGRHSVHTSAEALRKGVAEIRRIGEQELGIRY